MPIFEFQCKACGAEFEELVQTRDAAPPPCERCGGADTERILSALTLGTKRRVGPKAQEHAAKWSASKDAERTAAKNKSG